MSEKSPGKDQDPARPDTDKPIPHKPGEEPPPGTPPDPFAIQILEADPTEGGLVFTGTSSNHKMSFMDADTCCTCTA